jgi:hypothetical protein
MNQANKRTRLRKQAKEILFLAYQDNNKTIQLYTKKD